MTGKESDRLNQRIAKDRHLMWKKILTSEGISFNCPRQGVFYIKTDTDVGISFNAKGKRISWTNAWHDKKHIFTDKRHDVIIEKLKMLARTEEI